MVLVAVFALQNSVEVEIKLWFWSVRTSMVLILILTFAAGAIAGILFSLPKKSKKIDQVPSGPPGTITEAASSEVPFEVNTPSCFVRPSAGDFLTFI